MNRQLTYILITPYSLLKSRTGGIIGRILALSRDVRFVGARMYAPSDDMVDRYLATLGAEEKPEAFLSALKSYVDSNLRQENPFGISNRMMMLLFEGADAIQALRRNVVGDLSFDVTGDTVRGTYGDFVRKHGELTHFEPAVLMPSTEEANRRQLKVLSDFAMSDGGVLTNVVRFKESVNVQTTLVIIKPDNFVRRSSRPGNIIDAFSRTGLYIVGAKLLRLSQAQAKEFYEPLRSIFVTKLAGIVEKRAGNALANVFDFEITEDMKARVTDVLKQSNAEFEFNKIVNYMTGQDETGAKLAPDDRGRCLALLYQGEDAIEKIRERLGATDPNKAEDGTVRSIYAYDLMKNGAHASDSPDSAERERKIVGFWEEGETCLEKDAIDKYLAETE